MIDGTVHASDVVVAGIEIARLNATATQKQSATSFSADAQLRNGASVAVERRAFAAGRRVPRAARHCGFEAGSVGRPTDGAVDDPGTGPGYRHRQSAARCRRRPDRRARDGCREVEPGGVHRQTAAGDRQCDPSRPRARRHDRRQRRGHGNTERARYRIRSEGAGDCCRGSSPGRPRDGRRRREGNLERPQAYRQCHCRKPRRVAGNGRRHGSARRRRAGTRRRPESVSARRAECRQCLARGLAARSPGPPK